MSMTLVRHAHTAGHLAPGALRRCGCTVRPVAVSARPRTASPLFAWIPLRRQHIGFVRAHFIYSDRMVCLGA